MYAKGPKVYKRERKKIHKDLIMNTKCLVVLLSASMRQKMPPDSSCSVSMKGMQPGTIQPACIRKVMHRSWMKVVLHNSPEDSLFKYWMPSWQRGCQQGLSHPTCYPRYLSHSPPKPLDDATPRQVRTSLVLQMVSLTKKQQGNRRTLSICCGLLWHHEWATIRDCTSVANLIRQYRQ